MKKTRTNTCIVTVKEHSGMLMRRSKQLKYCIVAFGKNDSNVVTCHFKIPYSDVTLKFKFLMIKPIEGLVPFIAIPISNI